MRASILFKDRRLSEQIDEVLLRPRYAPVLCETIIKAASD
ncbi:hypothetical protein BFJ71_g6682 [Fusarium oxysporum]|nr:hypothetical protein BFJ71_g6682 [Fusarium oxysporum]